MIIETRHPEYSLFFQDWVKWRLAYMGGDLFIKQYLKQFSLRETADAFQKRQAITYCPAFAKAAINDIKNAIFQRLMDISRVGGDSTYQRAVAGEDNGVDASGSTMNNFIGQEVLPELLVMKKVAVWVDMPTIDPDASVAETKAKTPYVYSYCTEDILSWNYNKNNELISVLLRDSVSVTDEKSFLVTSVKEHYRHCWISPTDGFVYIQFYDKESNPVKGYEEPIRLNITEIPCAIAEISDSLMSEVANYQIALLNLGSSDMAYSLHSNFPFYVEEQGVSTVEYTKPNAPNDTGSGTIDSKDKEIAIGVTTGRRYPRGAKTPTFINPSSEPLKMSMEKQQQLKDEIRLMVNLNLSNVQPKMASAESKNLDVRGLEAGLSYIGLELEYLERRVAKFWSAYVNTETASVKYPEQYMLLSQPERIAMAKDIAAQIDAIPSITYKRELAKKIVDILLRGTCSEDTLVKMREEIDAADIIVISENTIKTIVETGVLSLKGAARCRAIPESEPEEAADDHADRLARIQLAQMASRNPANTPGITPNAEVTADPKPNDSPETDALIAPQPTRGAGQ